MVVGFSQDKFRDGGLTNVELGRERVAPQHGRPSGGCVPNAVAAHGLTDFHFAAGSLELDRRVGRRTSPNASGDRHWDSPAAHVNVVPAADGGESKRSIYSAEARGGMTAPSSNVSPHAENGTGLSTFSLGIRVGAEVLVCSPHTLFTDWVAHPGLHR